MGLKLIIPEAGQPYGVAPNGTPAAKVSLVNLTGVTTSDAKTIADAAVVSVFDEDPANDPPGIDIPNLTLLFENALI